MTNTPNDWLRDVPVTLFRAKNANHYSDDGARISLYDALFQALPGSEDEYEQGARHEEYPVFHWVPYVSPLDKRLKKIGCRSEWCNRHKPGEHDADVEKSFGVVVVEFDLLKHVKPQATEAMYLEITTKIVGALTQSDRPNLSVPSPSWGGRLLWIPDEPITSGWVYEGVAQHLRNLVQMAAEKAGVLELCEIDHNPRDWTRLWKCCKARGWENKAKPKQPPKWVWIDTLATHEPTVIHDRPLCVSNIPIEEKKPRICATSDPERDWIARVPRTARMRRALAFLRRMDASVDGDGVTGEDLRAISVCWSLGLDEDETLAALQAEWNERCEPPWPEDELLRKVSYVWETTDTGEYPWGWRLGPRTGKPWHADEAEWEDESAQADTEAILAEMDARMPGEAAAAAGRARVARSDPVQDATGERDGGKAAYARWAADPEGVDADDMQRAYRWANHFNANRDRGEEPEIPAPDPVDIVQREHPLICTASGHSVEWFRWDPETAVYDEVESIGALIVKTLDVLGVPGLLSRTWIGNIEARMRGRCTVSGLERQPCLIDWDKMRATTFSAINSSSAGLAPPGYPVACKTAWFLVAPDGTCARQSYDRRVFLLNRLPVDPAPGQAEYTNNWVLERLGEEQSVAYWQWASYCLTPYNTIKRFHSWYGPSDGGKSTGVGLLTMILGEANVSSAPALQLDYSHHRFATSSMRGKLLNVSEEDPGYGHTFEKSVKNITGGGMTRWEIKGGASGEERPTYRLLFTTNEKPRIVDSSEGFSGRMIALRWDRAIPKESQIPMDEMLRRFYAELPQIVQHCLEMRSMIAEQGLMVPTASQDLVREILNESNEVGRWFGDRVKFAPQDVEVSNGDAYSDYRAWCVMSGEKATNTATFHKRLKRLPAFRDGRAGAWKRGSKKGYWGMLIRSDAVAARTGARIR